MLPPAALVSRQNLPVHLRYASDKVADRSIQPAPKSDSSDAPAAAAGGSSMIREEDSSGGMVDHQPDYHAPVDHGTS